MIRIQQVLARTVPLRANISNALISFSGMTGSIVTLTAEDVESGERFTGNGFGSIGRYAHTEMILTRFGPRLLAAEPAEYHDEEARPDPLRMATIMQRNEKPGGHGERSVALGAVDMALWDLIGKLEGKPVRRVLAERFNGGSSDETTAVYAAGGYYHEDGGVAALERELAGYIEAGFDAVKIKIGGAAMSDDLARVQAAIALAGDASRVAVDANGRFDRGHALEWGRKLEPLGLRWFEEAGDPLDYDLQNALAQAYPHPLATGENLFSAPDVLNLVRYSGMRSDRDVLQMDPGLAYGVPEYLRMLAVLRDHGWTARRCFPHGGNLFNLHVAQGLQLGGTEAYPGVFAPFGGFGDAVVVRDGRARAPELPGIGWETMPELMSLFQDLIDGAGTYR